MHTIIVLGILTAAACSDDSDGASTNAAESTTTTVEASTTQVPFEPPGPIVFQRVNPASGETNIFTVNPDGSDDRLLFAGPAEVPRWSPDGTEVSIFCCDNGMAAHFVDGATGELRELAPPDPALETHCGGGWSPDGERLACEVFGVDDPSLNGVYSIRTSDGGDLTRITSNPGGDDTPFGGYSPDGSRVVFVRFVEGGEPPVGIFVVNIDGTGERQITPAGMVLDDTFSGAWSRDGKSLLIVARPSEAHHKAIWRMDVDGGEPRILTMDPGCGGPIADPAAFGCYSPSWSPDGTQIVFVRGNGETESLYLANADGSGVVQVTDGEDDHPHWGTPTR